MLNILMTMLSYINLRSTWQADAMEDSQSLQTQQMQSSNEQTQIMQQQAQEEALVQMELDSMDDVSDEAYVEAMQKMSQIAAKFDRMLQKVLSDNQVKERQIEQKITARESKLQAVDADIESLQDSLDKRTEEQFTYMQN